MYDCNFTHRNLILNLLLQSTRPVMINSFSDERRNQFFIYHILPNKEWARRKQEKNLLIWFPQFASRPRQKSKLPTQAFFSSAIHFTMNDEYRQNDTGRSLWRGSGAAARCGAAEVSLGVLLCFFLYFVRKTNSQLWRLLQVGEQTRGRLRHFVGGPLGGVSCFCFRFFIQRKWHC